MSKVAIIFTLFSLFTTCANARLFLGAGNISTHINRYTVDTNGDTNSLEFNPFISAKGHKEIKWQKLIIAPEVAISFPKSRKNNDNAKMIVSWVDLNVAKTFKEHYTPYFGMGYFISYFKQEEQTVTLQNGNTFEEFTVPGIHATSMNLAINLGIHIDLKKNISVSTGVKVLNIEDSDERSFNWPINITYQVGKW